MMIIDGYTIDCELVGEPQYQIETTDFPVEGGATFTDHAIETPMTLNVEGVISDTPIGDAALRHSIDGDVGGEAPSRGADARLLEIFRAKEPVQVTCYYGTFDSMVMISYSPKREGGSLHFTATFKRADFVTNDRTTVRVATPVASNRTTAQRGATPIVTVGVAIRTIGWNSLMSTGHLPRGPQEIVTWANDPKAPGGGYYARPDGKTPLTKDEFDTWQQERAFERKLDASKRYDEAQFDPTKSPEEQGVYAVEKSPYGSQWSEERARWEDSKGNPITKNTIEDAKGWWPEADHTATQDMIGKAYDENSVPVPDVFKDNVKPGFPGAKF